MVTCCQCPQSLLVHKPVLIPLLQLLQWCRKTTDERLGLQKIPKLLGTAVDRSFVRLINQVNRGEGLQNKPRNLDMPKNSRR
jgi:hypothetical protein